MCTGSTNVEALGESRWVNTAKLCPAGLCFLPGPDLLPGFPQAPDHPSPDAGGINEADKPEDEPQGPRGSGNSPGRWREGGKRPP